MRSILKTSTLEQKFPLLAVEDGCIISKDADITVAFRVTLPELFTVTAAEYEMLHSAWCKAIKILPAYSIVHKQDWYCEEKYAPEISETGDMTFLSRSFQRHFNERPFLNHTCYLFLTKTTKERSRQQSTFNSLARGFIIPKEVRDKEAVNKFLDSVSQFERIMNDCGFVKLDRLSIDEIVGTEKESGIIEKYLALTQNNNPGLKDMRFDPGEVHIGDEALCLHTISDVGDLPGKVATDSRYERLSTDRSSCRLSFAAPVGLLLPCNHIYSQYIFIDDHTENLKRFEKMGRNMQSLAKYGRGNLVNKEWIDLYLNEAHVHGLISVRAHFNPTCTKKSKKQQNLPKNSRL